MAWYQRFVNLFRRERLSRDVTKELDFHLSERTDDLMASGVAPREARRQARRQFGAYALHKEDTWMADLAGWVESLGADLRYALRGFANAPGFTVVAILSLALGIGANTAIFSLIDAAMLRDLPVSHPEALQQVMTGTASAYFTNPLWEQIRDHQDVFSGALAWGGTRFDLATGGESHYINGVWVSGGYFSTLGVSAALGRVITPEDDRRGCPGVTVLSHAFWLRQYGGDPAVLGKRISFESHSFEIVGVAQPDFTGLEVGRAMEAFAPLCSEAIIRGTGSVLDRRSAWWLQIVGRPKPGLIAAQLKTRLATLSPDVFAATVPPNWSADQQKDYAQRVLTAKPAPQTLSGMNNKTFQALWVLMAMVCLVLLIACANVANLMLARVTGRQREMAVRMALGAGRARLIRQILTESLLLSLVGAALGLVFAQWGSRLLTAMISTSSEPVWLDLALHTRLLLFTAGVGTATGVLFGLLPAWRSARAAPIEAMKAQGRGIAAGGSRMRLGNMLVIAQVAISMVLVAGAALMLTTFRNLIKLDPGFRSQGVLLVNADLRRGGFPKERQSAVWREILTRLRGIPGVRSASASELTPVGHSLWNEVVKIENQLPRPGDDSLVDFNAVSEGYLETLGIQLVSGRDFQATDTENSEQVAIVNESMARRFFGKASPLGQVFRVDEGKSFSHPRVIVGVVRDAKYEDLRNEAPAAGYIPFSQESSRREPVSKF